MFCKIYSSSAQNLHMMSSPKFLVLANDSDSSSTIAIVGAGFSGTMVATHLLKTTTRPLIIKLIEGTHEIGQGIAYSTESLGHLLNVSVGKMSAFPHDPGHLIRWLNYNYNDLASFLPADLNASSFIPRQIFGLYIQSILAEAEATASPNVRLEKIKDEAIAVKIQGEKAIVSLGSGKVFPTDKIVLAIGNSSASVSVTPSILSNPWSKDALADLEPDATVLLIGTGLTMVDMSVSLTERQYRGKIYAVSRRGLFPNIHQPTKPYPTFLSLETIPKTSLGLLRRIRSEIKTANLEGYDWRGVIDSLRPITQEIWQQLPLPEQKRFLRHLTPYWDVHRHRIAPEIGEILQPLLTSGQLTIKAGRIQGYEVFLNHINVTIKDRKTKTYQVLEVDRVFNCTGVQIDYRHSEQSLIASLRDQGLISPNPLGLGLDTTAKGIIIDAQGNPSQFLSTLGTPRKGDLWESIAVPELREQAESLAETILQSLPIRVQAIEPLSVEHQLDNPIATIVSSNLLFRQFFDPESSTYTYLIADNQTLEAVLVDTVLEQVDRDLEVLEDLGLTLRYCLETHIHADHITGAGQLRKQTGCQVIVPENATAKSADNSLGDGEILNLGSVEIQAIATPGHTNSHLAYFVNKTYLLTGDALMIRGCGRTDLQSGDPGTLYDTVTEKLFTLPEETLVYPAHDYQGRTVSTIGEEKRLNPRFNNRNRDQFKVIMANLGLSYPKKIDQAVPANEYCGDFIPEISLNETNGKQEQEKVKQTLLANREIYEAYFAMYI